MGVVGCTQHALQPSQRSQRLCQVSPRSTAPLGIARPVSHMSFRTMSDRTLRAPWRPCRNCRREGKRCRSGSAMAVVGQRPGACGGYSVAAAPLHGRDTAARAPHSHGNSVHPRGCPAPAETLVPIGLPPLPGLLGRGRHVDCVAPARTCGAPPGSRVDACRAVRVIQTSERRSDCRRIDGPSSSRIAAET